MALADGPFGPCCAIWTAGDPAGSQDAFMTTFPPSPHGRRAPRVHKNRQAGGRERELQDGHHGRPARRRMLLHDRRGAQETVDSILMVAVTLIAGTALVGLLSTVEGPVERVNAQFAMTSDAGADQTWGSGDERIRLQHTGGEAVKGDDVRVVVSVAGVSQSFAGAALGFSDGTLDVGEEWIHTATLDVGTAVSLEVIAETESSASTGTGAAGGSVAGGSYLEESLFSGSISARGSLPDLAVEITGVTPSGPTVGNPATFSAEVKNVGTAGIDASTTISVRFFVEGSSIGTRTVSGPLDVGQSKGVVSPSWSASATGNHEAKATVDPTDLIAEGSETNNDDTFAFSVMPGVFDPGFAYEDVNNDGLYDPATDNQIPYGQVKDCRYTSAYGLVVPPSVGKLTSQNGDCEFIAQDGNLHVAVDLESQNGDVTLQSDTGMIRTYGVSLDAQNQDTRVYAFGGDVDLTSSTAIGGQNGFLDIYAKGSIIADSSNLDAQNQHIKLLAENDVYLTDAVLDAQNKHIEIEAKDGYVYANNSAMDAQNDEIRVKGEWGVFFYDASARGQKSLVFDAPKGVLFADRATFTSDGESIELKGRDGVQIEEADLDASKDIVLEVGAATETVALDQAEFKDTDNKAKVQPIGAIVTGVPASGGWSY